MMHEMREGFKDFKDKIKLNNSKMDTMQEKIDKIERASKKYDKENKWEFDVIRKEITWSQVLAKPQTSRFNMYKWKVRANYEYKFTVRGN